MRLTIAHIAPLVALFAGVLILLMPRLLNYILRGLPDPGRSRGSERYLSLHA